MAQFVSIEIVIKIYNKIIFETDRNKWKQIGEEMPRYQIFEQCLIDIIYEVNAASKEEAQKIWDERDCYDDLKLIGEYNYESTGKINIEKINW